MAINIQNLIDAVNAKLAGVDSATPVSEITKLYNTKQEIDASIGVLSYNSVGALPTADSSNAGDIVFVEDTKLTDTLGTFYFSSGTGWNRLTLLADSDEDQLSLRTEFAGRVAGYVGGGFSPPSHTRIHKYPFAADTDALYIGDISVARYNSAQITSIHAGYVAGGVGPPNKDTIDKFLFATETSSAMSITLGALTNAAIGYSSFTDGYSIRGPVGAMEKFPFALEDAVTNIGTSPAPLWFSSHGSNTSWPYNTGWLTGGYPAKDLFNKFPFSSELNLISVGTLTQTRSEHASQSSSTHGYMSGGRNPTYSSGISQIEKFAFANETTWSTAGDLAIAGYYTHGVTSETNGYHAGGLPPGNLSVIQKFPFESDNNATQIGNLTINTRHNTTGFQQ